LKKLLASSLPPHLEVKNLEEEYKRPKKERRMEKTYPVHTAWMHNQIKWILFFSIVRKIDPNFPLAIFQQRLHLIPKLTSFMGMDISPTTKSSLSFCK
jgi:hypothetical protein